MKLSDQELYELTSSSAHSLNNVVMNMITLETLLEYKLGADDMAGFRKGLDAMSERVMSLGSAFSLLSLVHEEENLDASVNKDVLDAGSLRGIHDKLENYYEDMVEFRSDIGPDMASPVSINLLRELILNALGYLRFGHEGIRMQVVLSKLESSPRVLHVEVSLIAHANTRQGFGPAKKHCNFIALQIAEQVIHGFEMVIDCDAPSIQFHFTK